MFFSGLHETLIFLVLTKFKDVLKLTLKRLIALNVFEDLFPVKINRFIFQIEMQQHPRLNYSKNPAKLC